MMVVVVVGVGVLLPMLPMMTVVVWVPFPF